MSRTVAIVTMGCARNDVDSEELAGRLAADGWTLVADVESAEVAVVNTCGFIENAKQESIDTILHYAEARQEGRIGKLVVMGCLSHRYRNELEKEIPGLMPGLEPWNWLRWFDPWGWITAKNC